MKLTDTRIRNAKVTPKNTRLADGGGLYLLVTPSGGKLWRWKYRFDGKEKLMSFGGYPKVSLDVAAPTEAPENIETAPSAPSSSKALMAEAEL